MAWAGMDARIGVSDDLFGDQPAYAAYVLDVFFAELFAYGVDEEINGVALDFFAPAVDFVFKVAAGEDDAGTHHQGLEDGKFFVAQEDEFVLSFDFDLVGGGVEGERAVGQQGLAVAAVAAQDGAHTGLQLRHVEGFDDVVVGAAVQSVEAAVEVVAGGNDEDGGFAAFVSDLGEDVQPVFAGQSEVEQQQIIVLRLKGGRNLAAVFDPIDGIAAVFEVGGYGLCNHVVVFCKQYAHGVLLNQREG